MDYFVADYPRVDVPWHYPVRDLIDALERKGFVRLRADAALAKLVVPPNALIVVPFVGLGEAYRLRCVAPAERVVPFCWDVWGKDWPIWKAYLERINPPISFITALQSADYLDSCLANTCVVHCPEATRVTSYLKSRPLSQRSTDVLEFGRRHEGWHDMVQGKLSRLGVKHRFPDSADTKDLLRGEPGFRAGLADSVISVCFPRSLTHPVMSGGVETLTHRYLESLASGCIVLGHAPQELIDLFQYNPVVEVDWSSPANQVVDILSDLTEYEKRTDLAIRELGRVCDWSHRAAFIRRELDAVVRGS